MIGTDTTVKSSISHQRDLILALGLDGLDEDAYIYLFESFIRETGTNTAKSQTEVINQRLQNNI